MQLGSNKDTVYIRLNSLGSNEVTGLTLQPSEHHQDAREPNCSLDQMRTPVRNRKRAFRYYYYEINQV